MRSRHATSIAALLGVAAISGCDRKAASTSDASASSAATAVRVAPRDSTALGAADSAVDHSTMDHAAHGARMGASATAGEDSAFASLQTRGAVAMGVDQYASSHRFESLDDGGRIELQVDTADAAATERIREHLRAIARAFAAGNFSTPGFVHAEEVPGTRVMRARREHITYAFAPLARGGEVRLSTRDPEARDAIHAFLAYQRREHRTGSR